MSNEAITPEQHYIAFTGTHTGGTGSDFMSLWYDTIPSSTSIYDTTAYGSLWPDPFVQDGAAAMQHSLYATYTSDYDYSYLQFASNTADQSSYTFSSQSLGAADSERYIIVGISTRKAGTGSMTLNSVTIGGVSATISVQKQSTVDGDTCLSAIVIAKVPTGTTGDVVVTFSETVLRCGITMYRAVDLASTTADDTGFGTADPPSTSIDIPATGLAIAESATGWTSVDGSWAGLNPAHVTEVEGMTMSGAMSAFDSSQTGHTITCDWSTENDPVIVAASFNFAAPTTTNDERAAKITGQQSTNDERAAKTTGQQLTSDERSAKVSGTDTTNDERSAKVTGQVSTNDERSGKVTGAATTNDERSGKVTGALGSNDERAGKVTGQLTTNDERAGKVTGTLTANDERDAKLTGTDTTNAERDAKITGQDTSNSERDAKVTGVEGSSDERSAKVTGTDTISDERSAKTTGTLAQNDQRSVKLTGNALTNDERAGKLTGIDTTNDERSAKTTGGLAASAERSAKLEGGEGGSSERSAKLTGANPNVEGEVYMEFVTPTVAI